MHVYKLVKIWSKKYKNYKYKKFGMYIYNTSRNEKYIIIIPL